MRGDEPIDDIERLDIFVVTHNMQNELRHKAKLLNLFKKSYFLGYIKV